MRILFSAVLVLFAMMGAMYLLGSISMLTALPIPGERSHTGPDRTLDGLEGLGFAVAYLITTLGLYKRSRAARVLAMILVIWNLLGAVSNLASDFGIVNLLWLATTLFLPVVLFSRTVRAEFTAVGSKRQVA